MCDKEKKLNLKYNAGCLITAFAALLITYTHK
jgi:hypothetical protein